MLSGLHRNRIEIHLSPQIRLSVPRVALQQSHSPVCTRMLNVTTHAPPKAASLTSRRRTRIALSEHVPQLNRWSGVQSPHVHDVRRRMSPPVRE